METEATGKNKRGARRSDSYEVQVDTTLYQITGAIIRLEFKKQNHLSDGQTAGGTIRLQLPPVDSNRRYDEQS